MPAETERDEKAYQSSDDLDELVSNFLEELTLLNNQLTSSKTKTPDRPPAKSGSPTGASDIPATPALHVVHPAKDVEAPAIAQPGWYRWSAIISVGAIALVLACLFYLKPTNPDTSRRAAPAAPVAPKEKPPLAIPGLNDTALLLAGLPVVPDSPLHRLSQSEAFQQHRKEMQGFWARIRNENIAKIRQWRDENVPGSLDKNPVLYPLSGADYLNAYAFFPNAREYLLIALEPPGEIPDIRVLTQEEQKNGLSAIRRTVRSLASINYLQSKTMRDELTNSTFRGVIPILLLFASGLGHTVQQVRSVTIDEEGRLSSEIKDSTPEKYHRVAGINVPETRVHGVQIQFLDGVDRDSKSITYLQFELKDQAFDDSRPEGKFLRGLRGRNTILKSAVYLLHGANYGKVREFILGNSDLIIQDDSGIPYRYFRSSDWEETLFGMYTRPQPLGGLANPPQQPQLAQQYALGNRPLAFPYGYGALWGIGRSNLMLFVKKTARPVISNF